MCRGHTGVLFLFLFLYNESPNRDTECLSAGDPTFTFLQIDLERLSTNKKAHNVCKGTTKMLDEPDEWLKK